jgi:DNA segregation ATPase FtsK/SpoIIIE-like protein
MTITPIHSEYEQSQINAWNVLYEQAVTLAYKEGSASCYSMMSNLKISYAKAVELMDGMEEMGVVEPLPKLFRISEEGKDIHKSGPRSLKKKK